VATCNGGAEGPIEHYYRTEQMAGRVERNTTIEGQVAHRVCS